MEATINNAWITLTEKRNGVDVMRKFAGIHADIDLDNKVTNCSINYWERELYPNGEVLKTELKTYTLENLSETDIDDTHYMASLNVLDGFINTLGYNGIINPARQTLTNIGVLPLDINQLYPLHLNTRSILTR